MSSYRATVEHVEVRERAEFQLVRFWRVDGFAVARWFVRFVVPGARPIVSGAHESREQAVRTLEAWVGSIFHVVASAVPDAEEKGPFG